MHQKYQDKPFTCDICNRSYHLQRELTFHREMYHDKRNLVYCDKCGLSFLNRGSYLKHYKYKHSTERPFKCDLCSFSCALNSDLKTHKKRVHSTETFTCSACGMLFRSEVRMKIHFRSIHAEKNLLCDFEGCRRAFSHNWDLETHKKRHLNIRDHKCRICGASYFKSNALRHHFMSIHMNFKFNCPDQTCKGDFFFDLSF